MALVVGGIKVDPQGQTLVVNITIPSTGSPAVAYTATTGPVPWPRTASGSAVSFPVTISTPTTFYVTAATDYVVSAKLGSREIAGGLGATKTVNVDGQVVTLDPIIANFPDVSVADTGTFVAQGSQVYSVTEGTAPAVGDTVQNADGTIVSGTSSGALINAKIAAAAALNPVPVVYLPAGAYRCEVDILNPNGVPMVFAPGAKLVKASGTTAACLQCLGTTTATTSALGADAHIGDQTIQVASSAGFSVGQVVLIADLTYKYATSGRNQELNRVLSIPDGTHVTLSNRLISGYAVASTASVTVLNAPSPFLDNVTIDIPTGQGGGGIFCDLTFEALIRNPKVLRPNDVAGVRVNRSAWFTIDDPMVRDAQTQATVGYGVSIGESSHNWEVNNPKTYNVRENPISNNARHGVVNGGLSSGHYDDSWNTHGTGCEDITINAHHAVGSRSYGFTVGQSASLAPDLRITLAACSASHCQNSALSVDAAVGQENVDVVISDFRAFNCCLQGSGDVVSLGHTTGLTYTGGVIDLNQVAGVANALHVNLVTRPNIGHGTRIRNATGATRGVAYQGSPGGEGLLEGFLVRLSPGTGNSFANLDSSSGWHLKANVCDTSARSLSSNDRKTGNVWGTVFDENEGTASVSDGSTITHLVAGAAASIIPSVTVLDAVASTDIIQVSAVSTTTFTVSIKTPAGAAGSTHTVAWHARCHVGG